MFNIHLSIERWKWNADFGIYVSNKGRFRSRDKRDLPVKIGNGGYCYVHCEGTVYKYRLAHRVVMLTWRPTDDAENLTVDHLDHNKRNNAVSNLEWVTKEENLRRAYADLLPTEECEAEAKSEIKPKQLSKQLLCPKTKAELKKYQEILATVTHYQIKPCACNAAGSPTYVLDYTNPNKEELTRLYGHLPSFNPDAILRSINALVLGANKKGKSEKYGLRITPILK